MENTELIKLLSNDLPIDLSGAANMQEILERLAAHINHLINTDFEKLVSWLYRMDVSEMKLKAMLQENPQEDAANLIAKLMMERQEQKIKTRELFSTRAEDIPDDEKW